MSRREGAGAGRLGGGGAGFGAGVAVGADDAGRFQDGCPVAQDDVAIRTASSDNRIDGGGLGEDSARQQGHTGSSRAHAGPGGLSCPGSPSLPPLPAPLVTLFLFDIDGTLLRTDGVGRRSVARAVEAHFGRPFGFDAVSFSGKTDPQILREVLASGGVTGEAADAALPDVLRAFEGHMLEEITPARLTLLPGVARVLDALAARPGVTLAVLTGNLQTTAYAKLRAVGLDHHFPFGAFGSDAEARRELPAVALARAHAHTGTAFEPSRVVVVGDTEHDVMCARVIGARAVAVATGHHDRAALEAHAPDVLLDSCEDADAFLAAVLP